MTKTYLSDPPPTAFTSPDEFIPLSDDPQTERTGRFIVEIPYYGTSVNGEALAGHLAREVQLRFSQNAVVRLRKKGPAVTPIEE